jgi:hypothetical protein
MMVKGGEIEFSNPLDDSTERGETPRSDTEDCYDYEPASDSASPHSTAPGDYESEALFVFFEGLRQGC